jgi:hypothetical protein
VRQIRATFVEVWLSMWITGTIRLSTPWLWNAFSQVVYFDILIWCGVTMV